MADTKPKLAPINRPIYLPRSKLSLEERRATATKHKWRIKLASSAAVRAELTWVYNEYKRCMVMRDEGGQEVVRPLIAEDVRVLVLVLGKINEVLKDAITEGRIKVLADALQRLEEGKPLTPQAIQEFVQSRAFTPAEDGDGAAPDEALPEDEGSPPS